MMDDCMNFQSHAQLVLRPKNFPYFFSMQITKRQLWSKSTKSKFRPSKKERNEESETKQDWVGRNRLSKSGKWIAGNQQGILILCYFFKMVNILLRNNPSKFLNQMLLIILFRKLEMVKREKMIKRLKKKSFIKVANLSSNLIKMLLVIRSDTSFSL